MVVLIGIAVAPELLARMVTKLIIAVFIIVRKLPVPFCRPQDQNPPCDVAHGAFQRGSHPVSSLVSPHTSPGTLHSSHIEPSQIPPPPQICRPLPLLSRDELDSKDREQMPTHSPMGPRLWTLGVSVRAAEPVSLTSRPTCSLFTGKVPV